MHYGSENSGIGILLAMTVLKNHCLVEQFRQSADTGLEELEGGPRHQAVKANLRQVPHPERVASDLRKLQENP